MKLNLIIAIIAVAVSAVMLTAAVVITNNMQTSQAKIDMKQDDCILLTQVPQEWKLVDKYC